MSYKPSPSQTSNATKRVVIVSDDAAQRVALTKLTNQLGLCVLDSICSAELANFTTVLAPDLWCVDVACDDDVLHYIGMDANVMVGFLTVPASFSPAYRQWEYAIQQKILSLLGITEERRTRPRPYMSQATLQRLTLPAGMALTLPLDDHYPQACRDADIDYVCVLGASAGGLQAVQLFLQHLSPELRVAILLAQHYDLTQQRDLARILVRYNAWSSQLIDTDTTIMRAGCVYIVPVDQQIDFDTDGLVLRQARDWSGQFHPDISRVMQRASVVFGARLRCIIFSGMMNDGAQGAADVIRYGGEVWAQTAETCVVDSQPNCVRATGHVHFNGSPQELAEHLTALVNVSACE